ncbi:hypothetical protein [Dyadobacter sediminis]|uniref:ASCH domain-containing protein n=1 Tax=Dyadobacter sediminis TaxID=1493691 RepID=A0A5R9KB02_9BACT|nr:hypothetical protein [Dyadobacter sediminis]TLU92001.1 hypothetical protein FEM55_14670 [Dyadobacter sediminis]GGB98338.1 hypothetical protein GCM10011325_27030 [Dyadobacter sediminis]
MEKLPALTYSHNWNNKLNSHVHTTLRLWNPAKYYKGAKFEEFLKGESIGTVLVVEVKKLKLAQVNDYIAGLDTGYLAASCHEMIKSMYKNIVNDWKVQELAFVLLIRID